MIGKRSGAQSRTMAYHVGQIVFLAKHLAGDNWTSLSIPNGEIASSALAPSSPGTASFRRTGCLVFAIDQRHD